MTTVPTTTQTPQSASDPFPAIIHVLDIARAYMPLIAALVPQPYGAAVALGVPALEDTLQFVETARTSGADHNTTAGFLEQLATHLQGAAVALRGPQQQQPQA